MFFIGTNPHNVQAGIIVGHHHVKARSGWRKNGQVGYAPGGMDMGRTYPSQRIEYIEPYHDPEEWWVQLRDHRGHKGWVQVTETTYQMRTGTYIDLQPGHHITGARLKCVIAGLSAGLNISDEERQFWDWLSGRLKTALEALPGDHTLRIKGFHLRHECPDPRVYWGSIMVAIEFQDDHEHDNGFVAAFDQTREGRRILVRHEHATFTLAENLAITRIMELIVADLGV